MKLSEQVGLSYQFRTFTDSNLRNELGRYKLFFDRANQYAQDPLIGEHVTKLQKHFTEIESGLNALNQEKEQILEALQEAIKDTTKWWHERGYQINGNFATAATDVDTERNSRRTNLSIDTKIEIESKIKSLTDWKYPALEIGPGDGAWTPSLIAADPLFLLDVHQTFLNATVSSFPPTHHGRLRPYLTGHENNRADTDLSELPKNQFGFIFAWNVFDFFPTAHVNLFLGQCFELLRPGGQMLFSYNNCEQEQCASFAETGFKSWMPKYLLKDLIDRHGFELVEFGNKESTVHWAQIKKPGMLASIKAHVPMAKINQKPNFKSVDADILTHYNVQQIARLKQLALQMNVDSEHNIMHVHSPGTLHKLIEQARTKK